MLDRANGFGDMDGLADSTGGSVCWNVTTDGRF